MDSRFRGNDEIRGGNDEIRGVLWVSAGGHRDPPLRFWGGDKFSGNDEAGSGNHGGLPLRFRLGFGQPRGLPLRA